jgi:anti-sigma B factor antagonist
MNFTHNIRNEILFINLQGDLLGENNGVKVVEIANDMISKKIISCAVNLSEVRYMNSNGIGILITLLTKFRNKDGELVLIKPSEQMKKLLIITKLNSIFTIVESEEEAIESLNSKQQK